MKKLLLLIGLFSILLACVYKKKESVLNSDSQKKEKNELEKVNALFS